MRRNETCAPTPPRSRLMKLHDAAGSGYFSFTAYGDDYVAVNGVSHRRSLIVTPTAINDHWPPVDASSLTEVDLEPLQAFQGAIILLGTGPVQRFPALPLLRAVRARAISLEVMDTFAACRTYNILAAEGRDVVAALLLGSHA